MAKYLDEYNWYVVPPAPGADFSPAVRLGGNPPLRVAPQDALLEEGVCDALDLLRPRRAVGQAVEELRRIRHAVGRGDGRSCSRFARLARARIPSCRPSFVFCFSREIRPQQRLGISEPGRWEHKEGGPALAEGQRKDGKREEHAGRHEKPTARASLLGSS